MTETRAEYVVNETPHDQGAEAGLWQGYTLNTGTAEARRMFAAKFGYEPVTVKSGGGCILAGPVRESGDDQG